MKALSLGYALAFLVLVFEFGAAGSVLPSALYLMIPLLAAWFPQELGAWPGPPFSCAASGGFCCFWPPCSHSRSTNVALRKDRKERA